MNKAWITGLTLAGVAGSAGAAFAGVSSSDQVGSSVEAQGLPLETSTTEAAARTFTYQVGAAGTVTLTAANGILTVDNAVGSAFTLGTISSPAAHVEVQFADAIQQVTFIADLVGDDVVVSLTNVALGVETPTTIEITNVTNAPTRAATAPVAPPVAPAVPAAQPAAKQAPAPAYMPPAQTTKWSDDNESDDSYEADSHEDDSHEDDSHEDSEEGHDD